MTTVKQLSIENQCLETARRGVDWLLGQQNTDGSWKALGKKAPIDAYYKVAWAFNITGHPAAAERAMRITRQAKDLPELKDYTTDVPLEINEAINRGDNVLLEGSQGYGLSLFYGTYPYVTSKDTTASQIASDIGVGPTKIDETIVVFKAFPTRVGEGPFKTQMSEEEVRRFKIEEFGTVTGRARRIGLWDQEMAKYSAMINGATQIAVTGLDKLDPTVKGVNDFEKLTQKVKTFVDQNEREIGIPFTLLSTGPDISEIVDLREEKLKRT